jgi:hypothetical protein
VKRKGKRVERADSTNEGSAFVFDFSITTLSVSWGSGVTIVGVGVGAFVTLTVDCTDGVLRASVGVGKYVGVDVGGV